ncbi:MAG: hypothetical protein H6865_02580 [Rhodospirillales bacterium]|nr:hypothetical protein [Alphaproteobacteria bacterium]MCB9986502.1 hypothetical protein [Rhodospirillales bacterium]USO06955.1 MAG: hypothetical protein H6866_05805 [Rhodospirillales bacterium]
MGDLKSWFGALAALLAVLAHVPYFIAILRGTNRPHIFTWIIWTLLTVIAASAQIVGAAGPGAWSTVVTAFMCVAITAATVKKGERDITRADWLMFAAGTAALPVWMLTSDPLWAVVIVTVIDALAFGPTIRKSWRRPDQENITMYAVNLVRHCLAIAAIAQYSLVTTLYPAMLLAMNMVMFVMLTSRRRARV